MVVRSKKIKNKKFFLPPTLPYVAFSAVLTPCNIFWGTWRVQVGEVGGSNPPDPPSIRALNECE